MFPRSRLAKHVVNSDDSHYSFASCNILLCLLCMAERLHHELPVGSHLPSSGDDHTAFEIWRNGACCETEGHQHFFFICNNRSRASGGSLNKF